MKYYTETIPVALAEKLKKKGMPIETEGDNTWCPPYAEVFDWLMGGNVRITLHTYPAREPFAWGYRLWTMDGGIIFDPNPAPEIMKLDCYPSFHEAANAAIEKALELIKEG